LKIIAVERNESDTKRRHFTANLKDREPLELKILDDWIRISPLL